LTVDKVEKLTEVLYSSGILSSISPGATIMESKICRSYQPYKI